MDLQEEQAAILDEFQEAIASPDPDPDALPVLPEGASITMVKETAGHLCRSILRVEDANKEIIADLEKRAREDAVAWQDHIAATKKQLEFKPMQWRAIIHAWMDRNAITKLQTPWFTTFIQQGRRKIVVDDEGPCIEILETKFLGQGVRVKKSIDKKEFDSIWNATPATFEKVAHEETGEPILVIRSKE